MHLTINPGFAVEDFLDIDNFRGLEHPYKQETIDDKVGKNDSDWARDVNDRKSTTVYYFKLSGRGAALSGDVKKQARFAFRSSKAEYLDMAAAVQEALYLKQDL